jgi:hypothetical protein
VRVLTLIKFGSHLYGTHTKNSDTDYKGVYMPTLEDVILQRVKKSINTSTNKGSDKNRTEDVDKEMYSLHYFIELACKGETVALDMLHAPENMTIETSMEWELIKMNRSKFYTKNLKAFVGYARRQAAKYGIKGTRLNDAKRVIDFLLDSDETLRIKQVWGSLPAGEHIQKERNGVSGLWEYVVCGRKIQETAQVKYALDMVRKFHDAYGARAKQAAKNEGIDWKAVSHALRAAYQTKAILTQGNIVFPLPEAAFLKEVKSGRMHYANEVSPVLESLMDEVEHLSLISDLPERVDRGEWDKFIIDMVTDEYIHTF